MKKEFYKMFYEDWDEGVECFGNGEDAMALRGAYLTLCHQMYRRQGPISNDPNLLAHLWRVHVNTARAWLNTLLDFGKVCILSGGWVINSRVADELRKRGIVSAVRSQAGTAGGLASGQARAAGEPETEKQMIFQGMSEPIGSTDLNQNSHSRVEESRVEDTDSRAGVARTSEPEGFAEFWSLYPKRIGENPRKPALEKFGSAIKAGAASADIIEGLRRFVAACKKDNRIGTRFVPMAQTWLHQARWQEFMEAPAAATDKAAIPVPKHGARVTAAMCPIESMKQHVGRVYVNYESKEYAAWVFHYAQEARKSGKAAPTVPTHFYQGWSFPASWPPGHDVGSAPAMGA